MAKERAIHGSITNSFYLAEFRVIKHEFRLTTSGHLSNHVNLTNIIIHGGALKRPWELVMR